MKQLIALIVLVFPLSTLAQSYLCESDQFVGFKEMEDWKPSVFSASQQRLVVPVPADHELAGKFEYMVTDVDFGQLVYACRKGFDQYGLLKCITDSGEFRMSDFGFKYIEVRFGGYLDTDQTRELPDAVLSIGQCSKT